MKKITILSILVLALAVIGCSKEESKPAAEQSSPPPAKMEEKPKVVEQAEQAVQQAQEKVTAMAEQAGEKAAQLKEQAGEKVAQVTEQAKEQMAKMEEKVQSALPMGASGTADGEAIYNKNCSVCHKLGIAGAPKTGDKAAWAPHLTDGIDLLTQNAINGVGKMPPRGGNAKLTDEEVRAAVEYIVEQSR